MEDELRKISARDELWAKNFEGFSKLAPPRFRCIKEQYRTIPTSTRRRMTKPIVRDPIYRRRRFNAEIIELCVRWYITYRLSYRDLQAMMAERGIVVSHSTILWLSRYVPEFEKRWDRFARPVNTSWRVDETYIKVLGKWNYLYRAVDKHGSGFSASAGSRHRRCTGVLSQSSFDEFAEVAAQDHAGWPRGEPPGPSASAAGGSEMEVCRGET
jgi:hypothetical protein